MSNHLSLEKERVTAAFNTGRWNSLLFKALALSKKDAHENLEAKSYRFPLDGADIRQNS